jgi:hypothetical protein
MYSGINSEGINREVVATLECTSLNKRNQNMSLAIPRTAILHIMKALAANLNLIVRRFSTKDEVEADFGKIKGICQLSTHGQFRFASLEEAGSCHTELFNSFMHCNGCESLLGKDFNLCIQCHQEGTFERFHQMHPPTDDDDDTSTMNHTGKMASSCSCQKNSTCLKCNGCKSTALVIVICNSLTSGGFTQTTDSREILRVPPGRQGGEIEYLKKLKSG